MANPVNMEEKLALAKELNLKHQISNLEYKAGMFDLKFKPITLKDIQKRLRRISFVPPIVPTVCLSGMVIISFLMDMIPTIVKICLLLPLVGLWISSSIKISLVVSCWVDDFKYDIPYGGMLALKEAGECGITQHRIYFPTNDWRPLINHDPIITGIDKLGNMVEIYAWNENDIYKAK